MGWRSVNSSRKPCQPGPCTHRRWRTVMVYAVTSLTAAQAHPAHLAEWIRGHWGIEALHTSATAPSPRTPPTHGPPTPLRTMASSRNLAIAILRAHSHRNIAAALRRNACNATRVLPLLGITSP